MAKKNQLQLDAFNEIEALIECKASEEDLWPKMFEASALDLGFYLKKILPCVRESKVLNLDDDRPLPMIEHLLHTSRIKHIMRSSEAYEHDTSMSSGLVYGWGTSYSKFMQLGHFSCDFLGIKDGAHEDGELLLADTPIVFGAHIHAALHGDEGTLQGRCGARVKEYKVAAKALGLGKPSFFLWCQGTQAGTDLLKGIQWDSEESIDTSKGAREFSSSESGTYEKWTGPTYCGVPIGSADSQWEAIKAIELTNKTDRDADKILKKAGIEGSAYHLILSHTN